MKLSIVIPVFNEAATIQRAIQRVLEAPFEKELIVVDDGSTDGSRDMLRAMADPRVQVSYHDRNQGKGASLRTAFSRVTGDIVIIQDADLEYHPRDYPALIGPILDGDADVVYGSRFLGGPHRVLFIWHALGNQLVTFLANLLYNVNFTDIETGSKAFRRAVLDHITLKSSSFAFEAEFTAKVAKRKFRLFETAISYVGRSYAEGKKISWRDGVVALWVLIKYRFVD